MDRTVGEISLELVGTQSEDGRSLNNKKFDQKSDDIQNERGTHDVLLRLFNSKKCLKSFLLWIVLFLCLIVISGPLSVYISYSLPTVKQRNSASHIFSEERARDYLINLTLHGSRVINTRGNLYARHFLISEIERIYSMSKRDLRFEVDLQNLTDSIYNQLENIVVRVSNPIARSKNVSSLMLSAHYDSVEFSPGGSDDGSGVVILLELLSNLINDLTITFSEVDLIVLFTNAEEMDLKGSKAFMANHVWRSTIRRFISIDAASCNERADLIRMKSSQLIIDYSRVSRPHTNVIYDNMIKWIGLKSDYDSFNLNDSLLGYEFGFVIDGYNYHSSLDHPLFVKEGVLQDLGDNLGILIRDILLVNLEEKELNNDNDPFIYFDIFGRYLIVYKMSISIIIEQILIILIVIISIILIVIDDIYHRQRSFVCIDCRCIYYYFKYSFILRIISIIIYLISNIISVLVGLVFSMVISLIIWRIRPFALFGNSTLSIFVFSLPYLIGFILVSYLWSIFHCFILKKWPKTSNRLNSSIDTKDLNEVNFDFEQNVSVILVYSLLMIISIVSNDRLLYIVLVWSIFICPICLLLMIIDFIIHWKQIYWNFFEKKYHWLYFPLIICLFPLAHTIDIINRLIRILIPFLGRIFVDSYHGNLLICSIISIPSIFFVVIFVPIFQRIKYFGQILIILLINFFLIFLIVYNRQPFTNIHPNIIYAKHVSKSTFMVETFSNLSFIVPLVSQSSSITVISSSGLSLSSVLDHFSAKSGHILHNKRCFRVRKCKFDDTFNRTIGVQHIQIESLKNFLSYRILVRHVLSYNIEVSSFPLIAYIVVNQLNIPRTETIIDVTLNSKLFLFNINIKIKRCDLTDSPFLFLFTRLIPNIALMGKSQCQSIDDDATLIIDRNTLSNQQTNKIEKRE